MKYYGEGDGVTYDELLGGGETAIEIWNINVASDTAVERGMLLESSSLSGTYKAAASFSANKIYVIAAEDFTADSDNTVTQAYSMGKFNREKIKLDESLDIADFENELRKQNIHLTTII